MPDVVVTVPKRLWSVWLAEGDLARDDAVAAEWDGEMEYGFLLGGHAPFPLRGDEHPGGRPRVYIVAYGRLRGYAPLHHIEFWPETLRFGAREGQYALVRRGGAVACTIEAPIRGFQGYRYRWWDLADELPFPDWRTTGVPTKESMNE